MIRSQWIELQPHIILKITNSVTNSEATDRPPHPDVKLNREHFLRLKTLVRANDLSMTLVNCKLILFNYKYIAILLIENNSFLVKLKKN